jgi:acetylornithine aminotransferase/acetylornithine/N-succinyldiaminopimelate aminotransferase
MSSAPSLVQSATAELYDQFVLGNYNRAPLTLVRGEGSYVWDDTGRKFLDFTSGIAVGSLGHCHPHWVEAMRRQAGELIHVSNLFRNPAQGELAHRIVRHAGPGRVFFCNSGTEANEALIKLSRLFGKAVTGEEGRKYKIVCAKNAFHGRTFGGMSATPQDKIRKGFAPLLPGFSWGELNNLDSFRALVDDDTAAVFIETIQGEGGVYPVTSEFLLGLRRLCDERNCLLLLDEVQCGIGRTGLMFAYQNHSVQPDAVGLAKGLGGGFPIGAMWVRDKWTSLFTPGCHGTTFGGNPLACAAALAVLDVVEGQDLLSQVRRHSIAWHKDLHALVQDFPQHLSGVRGQGYLVGLQMTGDAAPWVAKFREAGLLVPMAGNNTLRILPPLTAGESELSQATDILRGVLRMG